MLTAQQWVSVTADKWAVQKDAAAVCAALDCRGQRESGLLQQLQASQASPRQQALLMRMLQDSVLGAAAREPLAARVLPRVLCSILPSLTCRSQ